MRDLNVSLISRPFLGRFSCYWARFRATTRGSAGTGQRGCRYGSGALRVVIVALGSNWFGDVAVGDVVAVVLASWQHRKFFVSRLDLPLIYVFCLALGNSVSDHGVALLEVLNQQKTPPPGLRVEQKDLVCTLFTFPPYASHATSEAEQQHII